METRYDRNRLYITPEEQEKIKDIPIILGGSGIGSVIAECALRLGFENITIVDGDTIELTNLNRQNYTEDDLSESKAETIKNRLQSINKTAKITVLDYYLTTENLRGIIEGHKIAINALDFSSDVPLLFDSICQELQIPVLHPYNLGWGGLITIIDPGGCSLSSIAKPNKRFNEIDVVEYASSYLKYWGNKQEWLEEIIWKYKNEKEKLSPPQLSIASWMLGGICTHVLFNVATNKDVKVFPEFYLSTLMHS
ncbi:ThiF family adenylyltransferase [Saccharicrinis aurantiacus]|uniref:ThiF family adenylyltransferase n=1 Tax=Saccharicrinis aurantiacus TaxID=1849719 RepID=UPI0024937464|nr:ThiF family adenylyltransferase [Saccharicrinis aurantiacus]